MLPLHMDHADELWEAAQFPEIWAYMPIRLDIPPERETVEAWIRESLRAQKTGAELPFAICDKETGRLIGSTRFLDISVPNRSLEIGWTWLTPAAWRSRINTECKYLLLSHCFEEINAIRVQFKTDSRNLRSQQAIERIGGVREGVLRHHRILPDGYLRDSVYFSILSEEWPAAKARLESWLAK